MLHDHATPYKSSWLSEKTKPDHLVAIHAICGEAKDLIYVIEQRVFHEVARALDFTQVLLARDWAVQDVYQGGEALWHQLLEEI